ncbi:hypothetical protein DFQ30_010473 [Apophysomyces sp. BC1015]|nr:hypothetical protein DFQ30_010473 [Apophysomyces sp. BC1015]
MSTAWWKSSVTPRQRLICLWMRTVCAAGNLRYFLAARQASIESPSAGPRGRALRGTAFKGCAGADETFPRMVRRVLAGTDLGVAGRPPAHRWLRPGRHRAPVVCERIHPFEDGNGRIGRAIVDMAVAQHLRQPVRLYSLSRQRLTSRSAYYEALNHAQRGDTDVTVWVQWFVRQCTVACYAASQVIDQTIEKRRFWEKHEGGGLHERQRKVLQRLLDDGDGGFLGGLNADKYMKMTGVSKATATRDLSQMVAGGQLWCHGVGKAVRYYINVPGWSHGVLCCPFIV